MIRIGYARISKADQNVENQVDLLKAAGALPIFKDEGISGSIPPQNRREFRELIRFIDDHAGEQIEILIFDLSRVSRSMIETILTVEDLERRGCIVKSLSPRETFLNIEERSVRSVILAVMSWAAERERENLIARTRAGLDRARREGKTLGRPRKKIDLSEIKRLRAEGMSHEKIARLLDCSTNTIHRHLKQEDRAGRGLA